MSPMLVWILTSAAATLGLGALVVARQLAPDGRRTLLWATPAGILVAAAALARLAQAGGAALTVAAVAALVLSQLATLVLPTALLWRVSFVLPAAGILLGAARSNALSAALSVPLALLVALAIPPTIRALALSRSDPDRRGAFLVLTVTFAVGASYAAIFLLARARGV